MQLLCLLPLWYGVWLMHASSAAWLLPLQVWEGRRRLGLLLHQVLLLLLLLLV